MNAPRRTLKINFCTLQNARARERAPVRERDSDRGECENVRKYLKRQCVHWISHVNAHTFEMLRNPE